LKLATALVVVALALVACGRRDPPSPGTGSSTARAGDAPRASPEGCPDLPFIEALHAAAYHIEHGALEEATRRLARAHALGAHDPVSLQMLGRLDQAAQLEPADPAQAKIETEYVRATLADWPCLAEEVHQRFHAQLPPVR